MSRERQSVSNNSSYRQIFRSSTIVGGAQILKILIGIARIKVLALILGPAGVGIAGVYQTIIDLVRDSTGFGIGFSGVKSIAEADNSGDTERISATILIVRRWTFATGLFGTIVTIGFSGWFSEYSFESNSYGPSISFLSVVILISAISAGQIALLQGLRKISEMAKATLIGTFLGTVLSLPFYWCFKESGIVFAMVINAIVTLLVSWLYARRIQIKDIALSLKETYLGGLSMAKLGFFMVVNGFVAAASMFIVRAFILSKLNMESVGYFQAVWLISTTYVNILLQAMIADYFPRLSQIQADHKATNQLINQQLEMTLLIGAPMLMLMVAFSPALISILYTSEFMPAVPVLRWQIAGAFFTFISWPMGVLFLSKNRGMLAIISELIRQALYVLITYFSFHLVAFESLGIGLFFANLITLFLVFFIVKGLSGFSFSRESSVCIFFFGPGLLIILAISFFMTRGITYYIVMSTLIVVVMVFSIKKIDKMIGLKNYVLGIIGRKNK
jgi:antigen flippase